MKWDIRVCGGCGKKDTCKNRDDFYDNKKCWKPKTKKQQEQQRLETLKQLNELNRGGLLRKIK